ncbi:MAG: SH3 domain-containing protein, partial [Candidatus Binatia bacterium]
MPTTAAASGAQVRRVYYSSVEGMKVYSEPSTSSTVVGTLSLHEKVIRSKLERGYAFVESSQSGVKGWVDNAQLIWRLPAAPSAAAP